MLIQGNNQPAKRGACSQKCDYCSRPLSSPLLLVGQEHTQTAYHASCASLLVLEIMADLRGLVIPLQQEPASQQDKAMRDAFRQAVHPRQRS
ncbi:hypothetical protein KSC_020790 [Ktedonobacter sp. SOSP1-52]|uniref:hypothetical protein n=1 Tax=Ktedonobacter sp. SOSP1-52 TaxID=2778366 RepID=UPI0019161FDA|nr:hypothetical protein [Ktedonobacter sp. SOSP1-52]GHO63187.1 hypothetical protein KSC_020790 [Ktedonobacter sp. SOSP1-52]